jgi:hypothetical protein
VLCRTCHDAEHQSQDEIDLARHRRDPDA